MYSQIDSNRRKSWILIFIFIGLLAAVGWVYGYIVTDTGPTALIIALTVSFGMTAVSWFAGDKIALLTTGAVELKDRASFPLLWNIVENLSITAGIPRPKIYIIEDDSPNAFATGRSPDKSSIAVTTGLLKYLDKVEIEGVIAHELSHIKNLDIRVMMLVIVLVGAITIIGDQFVRFGLGGKRRKDSGGGIIILIGIIFIVLAPILGELIKLAISRKREYLADASGSLLTRYPEGLARALEKIRDNGSGLERTSTATNHLWISAPGGSKSISSRLSGLLSTHPPIDDRINKLRLMAENR